MSLVIATHSRRTCRRVDRVVAARPGNASPPPRPGTEFVIAVAGPAWDSAAAR